MHATAKIIHLFALALWFGSIVFFSLFTALPIIHQMEALAESKPEWLPGLEERKQGTRLAGEALEPVFSKYFLIQLGCGAAAWLSTFFWPPMKGHIHRWRMACIFVALILVTANTGAFAPEVHRLRNQRYDSNPAVAEEASSQFGTWHTISLLTDMLTLVFVTGALATAAVMPAAVPTNKPVMERPANPR